MYFQVHLSLEAGYKIKNGLENTLIDDLANHNKIPLTKEEILELLKPEMFIGRVKEQVESFINGEVIPKLEKYKHLNKKIDELKV